MMLLFNFGIMYQQTIDKNKNKQNKHSWTNNVTNTWKQKSEIWNVQS